MLTVLNQCVFSSLLTRKENESALLTWSLGEMYPPTEQEVDFLDVLRVGIEENVIHTQTLQNETTLMCQLMLKKQPTGSLLTLMSSFCLSIVPFTPWMNLWLQLFFHGSKIVLKLHNFAQPFSRWVFLKLNYSRRGEFPSGSKSCVQYQILLRVLMVHYYN